METELPFRNIFCFDHDCAHPSGGGLVYGFHCVICRNCPASSDVVASKLTDAYSKRLTVIMRSQGVHQNSGSLDFAHGIRTRSIEGGETASPLGLSDDPVHLLGCAAPPGTAPENRFGHPCRTTTSLSCAFQQRRR